MLLPSIKSLWLTNHTNNVLVVVNQNIIKITQIYQAVAWMFKWISEVSKAIIVTALHS
jgi:hypothetical protein